ncbi:MAG: hypothetical protein Q8O67_04830 [Deltaproteobacteria bacterium]|nr:hypothetical protein [Deltaproteobacteria bacterium]
MIARALIALGALAVVGCFFIALANALPVHDAGVVVVADPAVSAEQRWFVRVLGIDPPRRALFVGTVNGVAVDARGLVEIARSVVLDVDGVVGDVPLRLRIEVPIVPPPVTSTSSRSITPQGAALLPVGDGPIRAAMKTIDPAAGEDVVVDVASSVSFSAELMVAGVTRAMADDRSSFRLPDDARPGDLVVVRLADSPLPSARGKTLVAFVKGGPTSAVDPERLSPSPSQTPVVSPALEAQQRQRQAAARAESARWRLRLRVVDAIVLLIVGALAIRARRTPVASAGAVVVVALLLLALDAVLAFVA